MTATQTRAALYAIYYALHSAPVLEYGEKHGVNTLEGARMLGLATRQAQSAFIAARDGDLRRMAIRRQATADIQHGYAQICQRSFTERK